MVVIFITGEKNPRIGYSLRFKNRPYLAPAGANLRIEFATTDEAWKAREALVNTARTAPDSTIGFSDKIYFSQTEAIASTSVRIMVGKLRSKLSLGTSLTKMIDRETKAKGAAGSAKTCPALFISASL